LQPDSIKFKAHNIHQNQAKARCQRYILRNRVLLNNIKEPNTMHYITNTSSTLGLSSHSTSYI